MSVADRPSWSGGVIQAGSETRIPIGFTFDPMFSGLKVYVGGGVLTEEDWAYVPPNVVIQNGANNSKFAAGLSVRVQRETAVNQPILYAEGVDVADKSVVNQLDRLTYIMQEMRDTSGRGVLPELVNLWYGWTEGVQADQLRGANPSARALSSFDTPSERNEKVRTGILGYPILIRLVAPAGALYYYAWIAVPKSWDNVFFFENFRHSAVWVNTGVDKQLNDITWNIWYKRVPTLGGGRLNVEVRRYE